MRRGGTKTKQKKETIVRILLGNEWMGRTVAEVVDIGEEGWNNCKSHIGIWEEQKKET